MCFQLLLRVERLVVKRPVHSGVSAVEKVEDEPAAQRCKDDQENDLNQGGLEKKDHLEATFTDHSLDAREPNDGHRVLDGALLNHLESFSE